MTDIAMLLESITQDAKTLRLVRIAVLRAWAAEKDQPDDVRALVVALLDVIR